MLRGWRLAAAVAVVVAVAAPTTAGADTFRVTNKADGAAGSLRDAVDRANANAGNDRIAFARKRGKPLNVRLTRCGPSDSDEDLNADGDLDLTDTADLAIDAKGARIRNTCAGERLIDVIGAGGLAIRRARLTGGDTPEDGGAIDSNDQTITLVASDLSGNNAGADGGAIDMSSSEVTIRRSTLSGNEAGDNGGAIRSSSGVIRFIDSTVSRNTAGNNGGGLRNSSADSISIVNSTFSGNRAMGDGGVLTTFQAPVTVRNATLVANLASGDGDVIDNAVGTTTLARSILAAPGVVCSGGGSFVSEGYNVVSDETCGANGPGDLEDRPPGLKPLGNNGGPTRTHALRKGSAARNRVPAGQTPARDQRGAPRKGRGDSGAYELVRCRGVIVNRVGTAGRDRLRGTRRRDGILGLGGADLLLGLRGNDGLCGDGGRDRLDGGPGRDRCDGGAGRDSGRRCETLTRIP